MKRKYQMHYQSKLKLRNAKNNHILKMTIKQNSSRIKVNKMMKNKQINIKD